ncbi:uncharacterized protein A1O9_11923 [Exophiala aquamarina CBS 119918]|uniref:Zn(2)-C6 fungal-type domain-containing protein n=1 Tax=Exophiala aquamarina CBS 119918 TaxID=1182545 RepID=A0A072NY13_9EURO|nr:uncharacterized protein A1O9_11923 [Exophiala aquamarina CBS 119918]KEF51933.1 hypothetical protein A1O9_11923 [Exophiala aquamarina CBS 119918]
MGNIGRPSTGCGLCRKRRVKCDEGRPGCRNCERLKKPCPGYREPGYGFIRTTVFVAPKDDQRQPRDASPPFHVQPSQLRTPDIELDRSYGNEDSMRGRSLDHQYDGIPTPRSMTTSPDSVTEQSVCYSLQQLDVNSRVLYGNAAFSFLPTILAQAGPDSCVYASMRSVGAINFANRSPTVDLRSIVDLEYARAVSSVTSALADPQQCLKDETLVAVWLLAMREMLTGVSGPSRPGGSGASGYQTHVDGTLMLLRLRGEEQFTRPEGRHLYSTLLSAMHWRPLFASEEPTQEYLTLESQISKATQVPPASHKLHAFFHGTCKLRARIKNFLYMQQQDVNINQQKIIGTYLRAARRLEDKMLGWCDIPEWLPRKVHLGNSPSRYQTLFRNPWTVGSLYRLHCFVSWPGFFHWNRFFVAKILLHGALLDALSVLNPSTTVSGYAEDMDIPTLIQIHTAIIHESVGDFLGLLAYAFGDVDGDGFIRAIPTPVISDGAADEHRGIDIPATLQVQPPLTFLITFKYLAPGQREAMFLALQRIQAEFCLK